MCVGVWGVCMPEGRTKTKGDGPDSDLTCEVTRATCATWRDSYSRWRALLRRLAKAGDPHDGVGGKTRRDLAMEGRNEGLKVR